MNIVISGTSRGIGRETALKFLKEGHTVYGFDLREASLQHENYHHYIQDIRSEALPELPEIEVLINNAGTLEEEEAVSVNLLGTMNFTRHFLEEASLKAILFIASASARNGAEFPNYVASKAGIVGYMKNLAVNLAGRGILVNSISPGGVITEANRHILEDESLYEAVKKETLLYKWAEPSEVAELAYYLTVVNRSVTGEDILMDNGEMLKSNFIW